MRCFCGSRSYGVSKRADTSRTRRLRLCDGERTQKYVTRAKRKGNNVMRSISALAAGAKKDVREQAPSRFFLLAVHIEHVVKSGIIAAEISLCDVVVGVEIHPLHRILYGEIVCPHDIVSVGI